MAVEILHIGIARELLHKIVLTRPDWSDYIIGAKTREQALEFVATLPELICDCACEKDERGGCTGIKRPE